MISILLAATWIGIGDVQNPPNTEPLRKIGAPRGWPEEYQTRGAVPYYFLVKSRPESAAELAEYLRALGRWDTEIIGSGVFNGAVRRAPDGAVKQRYPAILTLRSGVPEAIDPNMPAWGWSSEQARRYINWLHNGKPDPASAADIEHGAYDCTQTPCRADRLPEARMFLLTWNEYHKVAYWSVEEQRYTLLPNGRDFCTAGEGPGDGTRFNVSRCWAEGEDPDATATGGCCACQPRGPEPGALCDVRPLGTYATRSAFGVEGLCGFGFTLLETRGFDSSVFPYVPSDRFGLNAGINPYLPALDCRNIRLGQGRVSSRAMPTLVLVGSRAQSGSGLSGEPLVLALLVLARRRRGGR